MNDPQKAPEGAPPVSNKLKIPEGVAPAGMIMNMDDMTEAYVKSMIAVPAMLQGIMEAVMEVADSLYVLNVYLEKKGISEGLLTEADLKGDEDGQSEAN
jgi:hypothetical protein